MMVEDVVKIMDNLEERRRKEGEEGPRAERARRASEKGRWGITMMEPTSFYSRECEKTKLNWFCYELSMNVYDEVRENLGKSLRKHGIDDEAIADFSIEISKGMKDIIL